MTTNDLTGEIIALVERVRNEAYAQGKADAKSEMLRLLSSGDAPKPMTSAVMPPPPPPPPLGATPIGQAANIPPAPARQRAPRGLVREMNLRVLKQFPGISQSEILSHAQTEDEKMIKPSSIGTDLRRGKDEVYFTIDGRWYIADQGTKFPETPNNVPTGSGVSGLQQPPAQGRQAVPGGGP